MQKSKGLKFGTKSALFGGILGYRLANIWKQHLEIKKQKKLKKFEPKNNFFECFWPEIWKKLPYLKRATSN